MSLINKMLQDLDARGGGAARNATGDVRPVAAGASSRRAIAIGAGVGALIVAIGGGAWYYLHFRAPAPVAPVTAPAVPTVSAPAAPAAPVAVAPTPEAVPVPEPVAAPGPAVPEAPVVEAPAPMAEAAPKPRPLPSPAPSRPARAERAATPAPAARAPVAGEPSGQAAGLTSRQQGENAYRRALAALQEGRVTEGLAALEQAVQVYPRHEAARQTLVGLLIENGRADEAMRHAQLGLSLDANQPQLAMVLARLQLERGGPADETLLRSLPHAANNPDYIAFLAGVLQKQGRHAQAAEQYEAALRLRPNNGVWWMGLGMARQAENLRTNAREAYLKAKEAGLTPELHAFVERRLAQVQ